MRLNLRRGWEGAGTLKFPIVVCHLSYWISLQPTSYSRQISPILKLFNWGSGVHGALGTSCLIAGFFLCFWFLRFTVIFSLISFHILNTIIHILPMVLMKENLFHSHWLTPGSSSYQPFCLLWVRQSCSNFLGSDSKNGVKILAGFANFIDEWSQCDFCFTNFGVILEYLESLLLLKKTPSLELK